MTAAGALTSRMLRALLQRRGQAMQRAVPVGEGAMAALLALKATWLEIAQAAADDGVCQVANDNGGGQSVISGSRAAVDRAIEISKERGRQAGDAVARLGAISLRVDAARRR